MTTSTPANMSSIPVLPLNHESLPDKTTHALSDADQIMPGIHTILSLSFVLPPGASKDQIISDLTKGLANLLVYLPLMGGVLNPGEPGRMSVVRSNHEPVPLGIAHSEEDGSVPSLDQLVADNFVDFVDMDRLLPAGSNVRGVRRDAGCPVSVFQATFIRGGVILTAALCHIVADAKTIDHTLAIWAAGAKAAHESKPMPAFQLSFDKTYFNVPALPSDEELVHLVKGLRGFYPAPIAGPDGTKGSNDPSTKELAPLRSGQTYHFSSSNINKLKHECKPADPKEYVSTFDVVTAAVWQAMTRARAPLLRPAEEGKEQQTTVAFPVDTRRRVEQVPDTYIGNGFAMTVTDPLPVATLLGAKGVAAGALTIRHGIQDIKPSTIPDLMRTGAALMGRGERLKWNFDVNGIVSTSWAGMRVSTHYDFGFGLPISVVRDNPAGFSAAIMVMPSIGLHGADGVDVQITIEESAADALAADDEFKRYAERMLPQRLRA